MGGSESRFILGAMNESSSSDPVQYVNADKSHNYGTEIILGDRDPSNRYQKFRLQATAKGLYVRFDNHPQPGIRASPNNNRIQLYNASTDSNGEWALIVLQSKSSGVWADVCQQEKIKLDADSSFDLEADGDELRDSVKLRRAQLVWELEYVNRQYSAGEVCAAVAVPVAAVATAGVAAAGGIGALVGPALFKAVGFSAIPAVAVIGPAVMTAAVNTQIAVVGGLLKKLL